MFVADSKMQAITVKIPIEDYGWIQRYADKNDMTFSQVVRKAVRMYIVATNSKKKKKEGETSG